jgi:hypothetical protein
MLDWSMRRSHLSARGGSHGVSASGSDFVFLLLWGLIAIVAMTTILQASQGLGRLIDKGWLKVRCASELHRIS